MREAANFVNAVASGRTLGELHAAVTEEMAQRRQEIDLLARGLVEQGLATWVAAGPGGAEAGSPDRLMVRGAGNLLGDDAGTPGDLGRIRSLFDDLERKSDIARFLQLAEGAQGVRVFIGSENELFSLTGSSLVVAPYRNADRTIVGAVGVIGPTRLNYGRIVPIVDYTAQLVGRLLSDRT